jgi:NADH dehydrogenase
MDTGAGPTLIAGANGHLGRRLLARLSGTGAGARALVRSERAAGTIREDGLDPEIAIADYADADALRGAFEGCGGLVHLVGILKEGPTTSYRAAHEETSTRFANAAAAAGIGRIVYLSILGADPDSPNACLASKGRAERILLDAPVPAVVIRLPMVLGPGDFASTALRGQALAGVLPLVRGGATLEQPIDAEDVAGAVERALTATDLAREAIDMAGPECLSHRDLVLRAAALYGRTPRILSLPYGLVRLGVSLLGRVSKYPPITLPMLEVLDHDDRVDAEAAAKRMGISLTPLDTTLRRCVGPQVEAA